MSLKVRISDDMKAAMRAKDSERLKAIRLLLAAIKQREVDERVDLDDAEVLGVIDKMVKQRRESIAQFEGAGREDLARIERGEIAVLQAYLPQQLTDVEIDSLIAEAMAAVGASAPRDMGAVMGWLRPKLAGRADMGKVSTRVKDRLAG